MFEFDPVVVRFVSYRVCTRNRSFAQGGDDDLRGIVAGFVHPARLAPDFADDPFCQRDGRAARSVLFLGVVNLFDPYVVGVEALHHPGQPAVEAEHQVDAQAVVRGVEECTVFFPAIAAQLLQTICPARRAADDRNPCVDARPDVAVGRVGGRELQCYVDADQVCGVQFRCVRLVDDGPDTVPPFEEYFFDFTAHFAVSDDRCFHWLKGILRYIIANIAIRRRNKK